jgi:hypothetical protein
MRQLRDAMIQISDMVSARLVQGGSSLRRDDLERVIESGQTIVDLAEALDTWLRRGGYSPSGVPTV